MQSETSIPDPRPDLSRAQGWPRPRVFLVWILRQLLTILVLHAVVLGTVLFVMLLGDALFTSYAIVMQPAVFVSYAAQLGWLQRMAPEIKIAVAATIGLSAVLNMLAFMWRTIVD